MTLAELVASAGSLPPEAASVVEAGSAGEPVTGVSHDSRAVSRGAVFVAIPGQRVDGATFAAEAIRRGAIAIVAESERPEGIDVPWLHVASARRALADLAAAFYAHPSRRLSVVGVMRTRVMRPDSFYASSTGRWFFRNSDTNSSWNPHLTL